MVSLLNINFTYLGTFCTEIPTEKVDRPNEEGRAHPPAGRESRCQTQTSSRNPDSSRRWAGSRPGTADSKQKKYSYKIHGHDKSMFEETYKEAKNNSVAVLTEP